MYHPEEMLRWVEAGPATIAAARQWLTARSSRVRTVSCNGAQDRLPPGRCCELCHAAAEIWAPDSCAKWRKRPPSWHTIFSWVARKSGRCMVRPGVMAAPQPLELWSIGSNPMGGTGFADEESKPAERVPWN